jgi:hypothetical protein
VVHSGSDSWEAHKSFNFFFRPALSIIFLLPGGLMRAHIDIPDSDLEAIRRITGALGISRAEVVRRAIKAFVYSQKTMTLDDGFGLWRNSSTDDGLDYQQRMRSEWL